MLKMKNRLEYILFVLFSNIFRLFGLNISRKLAIILAALFYFLIPIRKKIVIQNLKIAFPELSRKAVKNITFNNYKNFAIVLIELMLIPFLSREEINRVMKKDNIEIIKNKFLENKGLITLSAHFGNWELLASSVSSHVDVKFHIIVKSLRNPFVDKWMNSARTKWMNEIIPLGVAVRKSFQVLKEKGARAILGDQRGPEEGIKMIFFGKETSVYTGPAVFSLRTGAPILVVFCIRQPDYSYKIDVHEINHENLPEDENAQIIEITRRYISLLEEYIKQYPEQWLWMHKRWKH
jgi:KDO2-lipid IV(A) lauroyltransferase